MPGRKYEAGNGYRYGFNGKEMDNDIIEGDYDFGARIYDARLGRFLSRDPLWYEFPWNTPYSFADNTPIRLIDHDGESPGDPTIFQQINEVYDKLVLVYSESRNALIQSIETMQKTIDYPGKAEAIKQMQRELDETPELSQLLKAKMWKAAQEMVFKHHGIDKYVEWAQYLSAASAFRKILAKVGAKGLKFVMQEAMKLGTKKGGGLLEELAKNPYFGKALNVLKTAQKSYEKLIKEHKQKIEEFLKDPKGNTDPKKLKEMMKDNPSEEALMERILNRIKALEKQIKKQEGELEKINKAIENTKE